MSMEELRCGQTRGSWPRGSSLACQVPGLRKERNRVNTASVAVEFFFFFKCLAHSTAQRDHDNYVCFLMAFYSFAAAFKKPNRHLSAA